MDAKSIPEEAKKAGPVSGKERSFYAQIGGKLKWMTRMKIDAIETDERRCWQSGEGRGAKATPKPATVSKSQEGSWTELFLKVGDGDGASR